MFKWYKLAQIKNEVPKEPYVEVISPASNKEQSIEVNPNNFIELTQKYLQTKSETLWTKLIDFDEDRFLNLLYMNPEWVNSHPYYWKYVNIDMIPDSTLHLYNWKEIAIKQSPIKIYERIKESENSSAHKILTAETLRSWVKAYHYLFTRLTPEDRQLVDNTVGELSMSYLESTSEELFMSLPLEMIIPTVVQNDGHFVSLSIAKKKHIADAVIYYEIAHHIRYTVSAYPFVSNDCFVKMFEHNPSIIKNIRLFYQVDIPTKQNCLISYCMNTDVTDISYSVWGLLSTENKIDFINSNIDRYYEFPDFIKKECEASIAWEKLKESKFTIDIPKDVIAKFSKEQIEEYLQNDPSVLLKLPESAMSYVSHNFISKFFYNNASVDGDIVNKYLRSQFYLRNALGNEIFNYLKDSNMNVLLSEIPPNVWAMITDDQKMVLYHHLIKSPQLLTENENLWSIIPEEKRKEFYNQDMACNALPKDIKEEYLEHFKGKYGLDLPEFYDSDDLNGVAQKFYKKNNDSVYGSLSLPSGDMINLSSWDSNFKDANVKIIEGAAILCKYSPLDKELVEKELSKPSPEADREKIAWGIKGIHNNTQKLFAEKGIKTLPVCRYKVVSFDMISKRFSPKNARILKDKLKAKKSFMVVFDDQPIQVRSLSSFSYDPMACFFSFGGIKDTNTLSVKEFINIPVEYVLALHGSTMAEVHSDEKEAIIINAYGLPCKMIVTFNYDLHTDNDEGEIDIKYQDNLREIFLTVADKKKIS